MNPPLTPKPATGRGRRVWMIVALLFAASFLNYLDRQTLSVLKPTIKAEMQLDDAGYAVLVNIFTFFYAAAYIASGWIVDRIGVRRALTAFIALWSLASIGSGLMQNLAGFAICRALLGIAEPGQYPSTIRAMTLWLAPNRRGVGMSLAGAGGTIGAVVAVPLIAWLATRLSWHAAFIIPGVAGLVLAGVWWMSYRDPVIVDEPDGQAKIALEPPLPWRKLWSQKSLWGIVLARFISDPVWYFCLFWMPGFFQERLGLSLEQLGFVGWIPFLAANLGGLTAAALSDRLGKRWRDAFRARRSILLVVAVLGPLAMAVPHLPGFAWPLAALSLVGIVCLTWLFILGPLVSDVFPAGNVASVWSIAGAFGATGAILFNYFIGQVSSSLGAERLFHVMGLLHPTAALIVFLCVRRVRAQPEAERVGP